MGSGRSNWSECSERYSPARVGPRRILGRPFCQLDPGCSTCDLAHEYLVASSGGRRHGTEDHTSEDSNGGTVETIERRARSHRALKWA